MITIQAGLNKFNMETCPYCNDTGVLIDEIQQFIFRDSLSAREYRISALCQKCQDDVFVDHGED